MHFPTVRSQCRENDIHPESPSLCQKSSGLLNTSCVQRLSLLDFPTSDGVRMEMQTRTDLVTFQGATFHLAITHTHKRFYHTWLQLRTTNASPDDPNATIYQCISQQKCTNLLPPRLRRTFHFSDSAKEIFCK